METPTYKDWRDSQTPNEGQRGGEDIPAAFQKYISHLDTLDSTPPMPFLSQQARDAFNEDGGTDLMLLHQLTKAAKRWHTDRE